MHLRWSYVCGHRLLWLPLCGALFAAGQGPSGDKVVIPKTWDDAAMATLELPLAYPAGSPKHVSSESYYRIPVGQFTSSIRCTRRGGNLLVIGSG